MAAPDQQRKTNRPRNRAQARAPQPGWRLPGRQRIGWALVLAAAVALALAATGGYGTPDPPGAKKANRLISEASPYLRSAAYQPVDWYPFSPQAFARAQELDRPILLDIGAVWCHWCHVMDRESYENPEIARLINEMFVAIKVDRDARPDIDARYQRAVQALTGQGGWPLTAFLTPSGKVFFGGTYFPPENRRGRPGLKELLPKLAEAYRTQKDRILAGADETARRLQAYESASAQSGSVTPALLEQLVAALPKDFDSEYGGGARAPKFPHGAVIRLALDRYAATRDARLREVAEKTLEGMARGGLRDYIHGGFYRYSTDRFWHVPHFEKMSYVQAELLEAFARAYQATGKPLYREAAEGILRYLTDTLSDQTRGGFLATQDADVSLDDDGSYFTWTLAEIKELLSAKEAQAFAAHYGVVTSPQRHPPETPDRNVLYQAKSLEEVAAELKLPVEEVRTLVESARGKLRAARRQQKAPFVDPNKFVDWNALVLSAYRYAYEAFGDQAVKEFALRTTDFLLAQAYRPGQGMYHTVFEGTARTPGLLRDQAYMALALLDMYKISGRQRYLDAARDLMDYALKHFWDPKQGGFFDVAHGEDFVEILSQPRKEVQDAPLPGANAVAALALDRLFTLTGQERYREKAGQTLAAFAGSAPRLGTFAATYARAVAYHLENSSAQR
ncbi:MAG: thioredoxin domain-containing protein [Acidobacteria bacterium]|nr:thioredoxin domain-containing protein [Acidobacteriota bacterium]